MELKKLLLAGFVFAGVSLSADKIVLKKPPESLDKYYPPASEKFEFLSNMHAMSTANAGITLNINEGNWEKALEWAKELKRLYVETSKMVPEWKDYFKPGLADELIKAVESKSVDSVVQASRRFLQTCANCHKDNELAVKLTYRFPSFENIKIEDPVDFMEYETAKYMKAMTNSLKALQVYLRQGEPERAQEAGLNFVERARQLGSMCAKCHTNKLSEEVILGKAYHEALNRLEELLSGDALNREEVFKTLGEVTLSCAKCHNVHLAPAIVRGAFGK